MTGHRAPSHTPRRSYTYRQGLTMMAAQAVGIDPYLAAEAGDDAKNALNLLKQAKAVAISEDRKSILKDARQELRAADRRITKKFGAAEIQETPINQRFNAPH